MEIYWNWYQVLGPRNQKDGISFSRTVYLGPLWKKLFGVPTRGSGE